MESCSQVKSRATKCSRRRDRAGFTIWLPCVSYNEGITSSLCWSNQSEKPKPCNRDNREPKPQNKDVRELLTIPPIQQLRLQWTLRVQLSPFDGAGLGPHSARNLSRASPPLPGQEALPSTVLTLIDKSENGGHGISFRCRRILQENTNEHYCRNFKGAKNWAISGTRCAGMIPALFFRSGHHEVCPF